MQLSKWIYLFTCTLLLVSVGLETDATVSAHQPGLQEASLTTQEEGTKDLK